MKTEQLVWNGQESLDLSSVSIIDTPNTLLMIYGLLNEHISTLLKQHFPQSHMIGCSTSGEISNDGVMDNSLVITFVQCEKTSIRKSARYLIDFQGSCKALGSALASDLLPEDLRLIFVISDGLQNDGKYLVDGFKSVLPDHIKVTGGLARDYVNFAETQVHTGNTIGLGLVTAICLYGSDLETSYGSRGGGSFGMERKVTRSEGNVLFELDNQNALEVYHSYLGDLTKDLSSSG